MEMLMSHRHASERVRLIQVIFVLAVFAAAWRSLAGQVLPQPKSKRLSSRVCSVTKHATNQHSRVPFALRDQAQGSETREEFRRAS
tara:strand:- start:298 stop:555 length:258 start_codon:yes stop_codon:yes gene_type:complete